MTRRRSLVDEGARYEENYTGNDYSVSKYNIHYRC
jgi:hypothetical protein